ncbi:hypothetical protein ACYX7E_10010 [Luteimonas sp. RIT-PG2_3]
MASEVVVNKGGVFIPLLAVLFIGLKLTGHVAWPWLWVLAPIWIPFAIALVIFLIALTIAVVAK